MAEQQKAFNPDQAAMDAVSSIQAIMALGKLGAQKSAQIQDIIADTIRAALSRPDLAVGQEPVSDRYKLPAGFRAWMDAVVTVANDTGMAHDEVIPTWPHYTDDDRKMFASHPPLKVGDVMELDALLTGASEQHPDDTAVDRFGAAMKTKLAKKRADGRGGWQTASEAHLSALLHEHVAKGDPVDVGNLAMMLHQNGQRVAVHAQAFRGIGMDDMTVDQIKAVAAELAEAAETMSGGEQNCELMLRMMPPGAIRNDDGSTNTYAALAVLEAECPEEGVYQIPLDGSLEHSPAPQVAVPELHTTTALDEIDACFAGMEYLQQMIDGRKDDPHMRLEHFGLRLDDPTAQPNGGVQVLWSGHKLLAFGLYVRDEQNRSVAVFGSPGRAAPTAPAGEPGMHLPDPVTWEDCPPKPVSDPDGLQQVLEDLRNLHTEMTNAELVAAEEIGEVAGHCVTDKQLDRLEWLLTCAVSAGLNSAPDEREIAAYREDAERYRFWREVLSGDDKAAMDLFEEELDQNVSNGARAPTAEELDRAVDAVRCLRAGKEGEPS